METIKINKITAAYKAIKDFKVSSLSEDSTIKVWDILSTIRPIVEKREADIKSAIATLNDDKAVEMQAIADEMKEKLSRQGYVFTEEDIKKKAEFEEYKAARDKQAELLNKKFDEETIDIELPKLEKREIVTALRNNDVTVEALMTLDIILN